VGSSHLEQLEKFTRAAGPRDERNQPTAVVAEAVVRVGEKLPLAERKAWYQAVYPRLLAYHEWLYRERDPDKTGLVGPSPSLGNGLDTLPANIVVFAAPTGLIRLLGLLRTRSSTGSSTSFGTAAGSIASAEHVEYRGDRVLCVVRRFAARPLLAISRSWESGVPRSKISPTTASLFAQSASRRDRRDNWLKRPGSILKRA